MKKFSITINGRPVEYDRPAVMAIVNITPDSFYAASRVERADALAARVAALVEQGADMIDVGACSTRPGSPSASEAEEMARLEFALPIVRRVAGDLPVSVDTFRASVAERAVLEFGADIINDISGGAADSAMFQTVARLKVPYVLMHMRGTPADMQTLTNYSDVTADVIAELSAPLARLEELGVNDVIVDPGFGFAKTLEQNYTLLRELAAFEIFDRPVLVGMSRKSMATRLLGITPDQALPATCVLNTLALERGAAILRVHDAAEAVQTVKIFRALNS